MYRRSVAPPPHTETVVTPTVATFSGPVCGVCGQPGTSKTTVDGELGPLNRKPGEPWLHYRCWLRYRAGEQAPVVVVPQRVRTRDRGHPVVIVESKAGRISVMWMVFIVVVIAVLLLICYSSTVTIRPIN
jgi:hypothetical protein